MRFKYCAAAFSILVVLSSSQSLQAADEPPVVQAIFRTWEQQFQAKPTVQKLETDSAGNITIEGIAATVISQDPAQPGSLTINIGKMKLAGVSDQGGGMFEIANTQYTDLVVEFASPDGTKFTVKMPQSEIEGWYVTQLGPTPTPTDIMRASMNIARRTESGKITIDLYGQSLTIDGYQSTWDGDPVTGAGKFDATVSNFAVPAQAIAAIDPTGEIKKLGYTDLSFDFGGTGNIDVGKDIMGFTADVFLKGRDAGTIKFGVSASNVPVAVYAELANPTTKDPDFNKLMPQLMGVTLSKLQVRFEDASLTKRILPVVAAAQGMDEASFVASAGAMLTITLAQLKNQPFVASVSSAVTTFLKDPKSITLSIAPPNPVQVQQLMTLDAANPGAAITTLGVGVTAND
jgi:hypothetical protein